MKDRHDVIKQIKEYLEKENLINIKLKLFGEKEKFSSVLDNIEKYGVNYSGDRVCFSEDDIVVSFRNWQRKIDEAYVLRIEIFKKRVDGWIDRQVVQLVEKDFNLDFVISKDNMYDKVAVR